MLTPEELEKLSGGETLFRAPIPVQFVSSDEYMPSPQSAQQKEFEARIREMGAKLAKKHHMTRRRFFKTAGGMAAAFAAMNQVHAKSGPPLYEVGKNEVTDLDVAQARADARAGATAHRAVQGRDHGPGRADRHALRRQRAARRPGAGTVR